MANNNGTCKPPSYHNYGMTIVSAVGVKLSLPSLYLKMAGYVTTN